MYMIELMKAAEKVLDQYAQLYDIKRLMIEDLDTELVPLLNMELANGDLLVFMYHDEKKSFEYHTCVKRDKA